MARFLVDMCTDVRVARWLADAGHDAKHLRDENLHRLPNGRIFAKAAAENRIVVTFDLDFGEIISLSGRRNVSAIVFRLRNTRAQHVLDRLSIVLPKIIGFLASGAIVIIEDGRFRVRHLPFAGRQ
jgi:predicted nuclease of predicted toxin-antitoxin system